MKGYKNFVDVCVLDPKLFYFWAHEILVHLK